MNNYRYGKFSFRDYGASWLAIACLITFSITNLALNLPNIFSVFTALYALIWLLVILIPHREKFDICNEGIVSVRGRKKYWIDLPSELTLIVSYVDICPPLVVQTAVGKRTHILKGKVGISILRKLSANTVLEKLHKNHVQQYTTSRIKTVIDEHFYIYSFVYDQIIFDALVANRRCSLIVPKSLLGELSVNTKMVDLWVDSKG